MYEKKAYFAMPKIFVIIGTNKGSRKTTNSKGRCL
jgi:hypothetical protein